jgi:hypothetical protein
MQQLSQIWPLLQAYIKDGLSIIPVRDKEQNGKPPKTPYAGWKNYQKEIISEGKLFSEMEYYDTTAVAILGGKVSGNLEIIDVDVKNWPGIDADLFTAINNLYPKLFESLRIHKTPSGGFHILYRISDHEPEGNLKLAYRTDAKEAAIETRGEGGYIVAPPGVGYSVYKKKRIPVITWEERCSLITICRSFNQQVKVIEAKPKKSQKNDYYSENPFEHFNGSNEGAAVLNQFGWQTLKESNKFVWFTRPGKNTGISASFNKEKLIYYIFTSSTEFEPSKGYTPSSALAILKFNNDKSQLYKHLVNSGYGKIKPEFEKKKAKELAKKGKALAPNFSSEAVQLHAAISQQINEAHPYGVFWYVDEQNKYKISFESLLRICREKGFRLFRQGLVQIIDKIYFDRSERELQDELKAYIQEEEAEIYDEVANAFEMFMQKHGKYLISRMPLLSEENILNDTKNVCFKFFKNCVVVITAKEISYIDYNQLDDRLIYSKKILNRDYNYFEGGLYVDYLSKATDWKNQSDHVKKCIGYLSHEYKDETTGYIIVLTEQCPDPQDGGGSGKNLFCNLLSNTTTYHSKNGTQLKFDEKFFQSWSGQRIMGISDVPENFNFAFLKEPSTGTFILKKLFKDEVEIPVQDGPKFIVQTNFSYEITDGGLRRRIIHIEFTDFFTKANGVDVYYGKHFTNDWTNEDWHGFDTLIIESIKLWLESGRKLKNTELTQSGWEKQFIHTFGKTTVDLVYEFIDGWIEAKEVEISQMNNQINNFMTENNIPKTYQPSKNKINKAIEYYCKHKKIECNLRSIRKILGIPKKVAVFGFS